ncbi:MAG: ImmA/IrrE family metallo-endopeptidase [Candidatus Micrarchaeota archaeon]|nr:ImmA/IrrE family metallo-endopeptidase [Candidatus Micrarchaeota archaeon]
MAKAVMIKVKPSVLKWARTTSGLEAREVEKKLKLKQESINKLESHEDLVELKLLERIAHLYKRPLVALLMLTPPQEPPQPHDFRKLPESSEGLLSSKALLAIRRARHAQSVAVELMEAVDKKKLYKELPNITLEENPDEAAKRVKKVFNRLVGIQAKARSVEAAFENWKSCIESLGIIVFQANFPIEEIRGLSLKGEPPTMILNSTDTHNGKIFTLFHELCHLLLGNDGICSIDLSQDGRLGVETFCNNFAGYFLVTPEELSRFILVKDGNWEPSDKELKELSDRFKVSKPVILRRLINSGFTPAKYYSEMDGIWRSRPVKVSAGRPRQLPGYRKAIKRYGKPFVKLVLDAKSRNKITDSDAADYLNIKADQFKALENAVT